MFHSRNGLFFQATGQGNVCIIKTSDGKEPYSRSFPDSDKVESNIVCDVTLPENEWASVVCAVSSEGEDPARWMRARRFHGTDLPFAENELKNASQEELTPEQREWMDAPMGPSKQSGNTAAELIAGIDEMMTKLGYLIQEDRLISLAVVSDDFLVQKALREDHSAAYQKYKNELREISERHGARCSVKSKAHRERLAASINPKPLTAE